MEYKIFKTNQQSGTWKVYSGHTSHGDWIKDDLEYSSNSIADCYAWIKAKQENLLDLNTVRWLN
jgi:hypothetical protein